MPFSSSSRLPYYLGHSALVIGLCAGLAHAQTLPSLAVNTTVNDTQVLPVWNTSSGRLEALLVVPSKTEKSSALDRLFPRDAELPSVSLTSQLNNGSKLSANLKPDSNSGLALLCSQGIQVAMTLGPLSEQCLLTQLGADSQLLAPISRRPSLTLESQWQSPQGAVDLTFGLSWLDSSIQTSGNSALPAPGQSALELKPLPSLMPTSLAHINARQWHVSSRFNLPNQHWWSIGGSLGQQSLSPVFGHPLNWDSATVTLGVGYRGFSGRLTGRLIEVPESKSNINGLDLGFSWRTPWQGELSIGAQNLLDQKPDTSKWPLAELPAAMEIPGGRTPYVRYKQDL